MLWLLAFFWSIRWARSLNTATAEAEEARIEVIGKWLSRSGKALAVAIPVVYVWLVLATSMEANTSGFTSPMYDAPFWATMADWAWGTFITLVVL